MGTASVTYAAFPAIERTEDPFAGRGWRAYAIWAALLTPFAIPGAAAQMAFVDVVNAVAFVAFFAIVLTRGLPVRLPFLLPVLLVGTGTLLSLTAATSLSAAALAIVQDLYLYLWLVVLYPVIARRGAPETVARAWVAAAVVIAAICFGEAIQARGLAGLVSLDQNLRTKAMFYNPNMCADYLVLSLFVLLSLAGTIKKRWLLAAGAALGLALVTTKSNGGIISLAAGSLVALATWAWCGAPGRAQRVGALAAACGLIVAAAWMLDETRIGGTWAEAVRHESFVGRLEKSTDSRETIWGELGSRVAEHPLGIAPGNSSLQPVAIGHRVRKDSFQSKEAHSDYVAYFVERGAIGFAGLVLAIVTAFLLIARAASIAGARAAGDPRIAIWAAAALGGLAASSVHSLVIEKLHFRHFWLFLAWACASAAWMASDERAREALARLGRPRAEA
jgi:hypothetical protein